VRTDWPIGPFADGGEVLGPDADATFECPVLGKKVAWAAKDVFNPAAIVRDGKVHLLVRAEDRVGPFAGTSRVGLAVSTDGVDFSLHPEPVLFPDGGRWLPWEWPGGCEDPRVVESPDGGYVCCYSAFDGKSSCLMVATSDDLVHWEKHGPAFATTPFARRWSKSGSIVTAVEDGRLLATRIDGRFHMYWGEGTCFLATSDDLVHWVPLQFDTGADRYLTYSPGPGAGAGAGAWEINAVQGHRALRPVLVPRPGRFDSLLVEPGPPAVLSEQGILLIYNGAELRREDGRVIGVAYRPGQALFDPREPGSPIARCTEPFALTTTHDLEGQVDQVCFAEGLALFRETWFMYYGMADSRIGYATAVPSK
jgi:beta-1,2-mannosidase